MIGRGYPEPIVDHMQASRAARERIWAVRKGVVEYSAQADAIQARHGSRRSGIQARGQRPRRARGGAGQLDQPL